MAADYVVETLFDVKGNAAEYIRQITRGFQEVDRLVSVARGNLAGFGTELRELSAGNRGIGNLVRQLEKIRLPAGALDGLKEMTNVTRDLAASQANMARDAAETARSWRVMAEASRSIRPPSGGGGGAGRASKGGSHVSGMDMAMGAQIAGNAGTSLLESALTASLDVGHLMAQFSQNTTINPADLKAIRSKADALTSSVPGTTIAENLHTILDAYTITGQIGEALAASQGMAKARVVYESLPGAHKGDPAYAAGQAIEVMQRFYDPTTHQVDMGAFNQQLAAMVRVAVGTGGRDDGRNYLAFAKQARLGGMLASDDFLYGDLPAIQIALGGSRAGTGDAATYRQFLQGKMTKNAFGQLQRFGLIDGGADWHGGQVRDMSKHLRGAGEFITNPAAWVRDVMLPDLKQHGVNTNDRAAVGTNIGQWASTSTGLGFLLELALGMPGILKEKGKIGATSADPLAVIQQTDPQQKVREFHAAETNLLTVLGDAAMGPALASMNALTGALRGLTDWARANPNAAKDLMLVGGGLAVVAKVAGDAAMALYITGPLVMGLKGFAGALMPFRGGGAATTALATLTAASGAGSLFGLGAAIVGLGAAMAGLAWLTKAPDGSRFVPNGGQGSRGGHWEHQGPDGSWSASAPPKTATESWWDDFASGKSAPAGGTHRGSVSNGADGLVHKSSFETDGTQTPVVIPVTLTLDGKTIYQNTVRRMADGLRSQAGPTSGDMRGAFTPPGATTQI